MITIILQAFAFVLFIVAAFWNPAPSRVNLGWLGAAFWVLSILLAGKF